jgi:hypothetical protein
MPVRQVSNHGRNIVGKFPSLKLRRMVAFESLIERDYLYFLDYELVIEWFEEQPMTIEYQDEGKVLHYTPDFHLIEAGQNVLVECKPEALISDRENQRKFQAAMRWCTERDWDFRVITDHQLRTGHRLENIKLMTYYARLSIPPQVKAQICAMVAITGPGITVGDMAKVLDLDHRAMALPIIMHLAFHHEVVVPLEAAPLSLNSPVSPPLVAVNPLLEVKL